MTTEQRLSLAPQRQQRIALSNEWHARPSLSLPAPFRCTHVVTLRSETSLEQSRRSFAAFCADHSQGQPAADSRHHSVQIGSCLIKWEGHTEATSHTIMVPGNGQPPFAESALDFLDTDKREELVSDMFVGVKIEVLVAGTGDGEVTVDYARSLLGARQIYGGTMSESGAEVWSAFRHDAEGFVRIVIIDRGISEERLSRLLQRLLEMETYRMLAMMALPRARGVMAELGELEPQLDEVMGQLARRRDESAHEELLRRITAISAQAEHIAAANAYRFAAARAYAGIVERRIKECNEQRLGSYQRYSNFLLKTLQPAMRTCDAAEQRTHEVAERVARAAGLLGSMVDMVQKKQNQAILETMAERATLQLRLQQAVEGFSIFAISYYAVGLIAYGLKSAKALGAPMNPEVATGFAAPAVFALVWLSVRTVRRRLHGEGRP
ncbi:DUF3422 domain-containing protein [Pseudohaliea rubra]|uniref:Membrane-anchored protein n=1 Tax=Pseudohaliea rubra DSM 19751 TaxID=1265313 RepID=A0A095XTN4_9GAMM|nr:DUF3422 domain-containing protein [Pseudohaliea rubra]KGE03016.1 hypothetical protein HRUBRA_02389 [Pseudohaliea rubra DSM 19751]